MHITFSVLAWVNRLFCYMYQSLQDFKQQFFFCWKWFICLLFFKQQLYIKKMNSCTHLPHSKIVFRIPSFYFRCYWQQASKIYEHKSERYWSRLFYFISFCSKFSFPSDVFVLPVHVYSIPFSPYKWYM